MPGRKDATCRNPSIPVAENGWSNILKAVTAFNILLTFTFFYIKIQFDPELQGRF